ncbi:8853_t:CDS:2, partial [Racocetra fulgida]
MLQNDKNEIMNLKNYYENEILNLKTHYENETLYLKNYHKSEILKLENNYNQIQNNYNIETNNLNNKIFLLEQKLKNLSIDLFSNNFKKNIENLSNLLYKKQYEEKCFPPTDPNKFMDMMNFSNLKLFVLMFFNAFKSDNNQSLKSIEKLKIRIIISNILKILFVSSNNVSLFKTGLISINHLNNALSNELRNNLISYNSRKLEWKNISDILSLSTESLIESLSVHMYD